MRQDLLIFLEYIFQKRGATYSIVPDIFSSAKFPIANIFFCLLSCFFKSTSKQKQRKTIGSTFGAIIQARGLITLIFAYVLYSSITYQVCTRVSGVPYKYILSAVPAVSALSHCFYCCTVNIVHQALYFTRSHQMESDDEIIWLPER